MTSRRWIFLIAAGAVLALAIPPAFFWLYEGPRTSRSDDGLWTTFMRHSGEQSIELSRAAPDAEPTTAEVGAAARLLEETTAGAARYTDFRWTTTAGGFTVSNAEVLGRPDSRFHHLFNPEHMADGRTLDPKRPESLVFHRAPGGMELVGVMYMMPPGQHGPQPGGRLTRWHYHPVVEFCMDAQGVPTVRAARGTDGGCPAGTTHGPTPEMLHVWIADNPLGAFAHQMALPGDHTAHHVASNPYSEFARRTALWVKRRVAPARGEAPPAGDVRHAEHATPAAKPRHHDADGRAERHAVRPDGKTGG